MKFGLSRYTSFPDYSSTMASVPPEAAIDDDVATALFYSVFFQTKAYHDFGAMISVAYSVLNRHFGIENIFSNREEFVFIPNELLIYREFQKGKLRLKPFAGIGFALGRFGLSNRNHISRTDNRWVYAGSTIGFPIGFGIGYHLSNTLRLGTEIGFRYYEIENFESDYRCSDGGSNAFVFLDGGVPGPSCLESGGEPRKHASIDYSSLNISILVGFGR